MPIDRTTARALVEAGYMPLSEYVALFGDTVTAPDIVPAIETGLHDAAAQGTRTEAPKPEGVNHNR